MIINLRKGKLVKIKTDAERNKFKRVYNVDKLDEIVRNNEIYEKDGKLYRLIEHNIFKEVII